MIRTIFATAAFAVALAGDVAAQSYPRLSGGAENSRVEYEPEDEANNIVGGGGATMTGSGDEARLSHADPAFAARVPGNRIAVADGDGGTIAWVILPGRPSGSLLASR